MIAFGPWVFLAAIFINGVLGEVDTDVCSVVTESCGLVPPVLPEDFELEGECVNYLNNTKDWEAMYFDSKNLRIKSVIVFRGMEYHMLFDYNVSQILKYIIVHPGMPITLDPLSIGCQAVEMEDAPESPNFGYRDGTWETKRSKMYDSNRVLRFGGPYPYAFNGTDDLEDRGMKTNSFRGCVYESEIERTSAIRYNFSSDDLVPAGGVLEYDIDGMENSNYESIPLGLDVSGTIYGKNSSGSIFSTEFKKSCSFNWFKANPIFMEQDFQIPPWMHCTNYRGWKKMPNFPMAFSSRIEETAFNQDILGKKKSVNLVSSFEVYYYNEKGLARRDYTPTIEKDADLINEFGNLQRVKQIFDFNTGVIYTTHLSTGRCFSRTIRRNDYFETPENKNFDIMITPEELFGIDQNDMQYKGQYFFRDINCDSWSGKMFDTKINDTVIKETYMSTNGWHSETDEKVQYGIPVRHTTIINVVGSQYVSEINFFKFKAYAPPLRVFDISECAENVEHNFYAILLNVNDDIKNAVDSYKFLFLEESQYYLSNIAQVGSPLRIQRMGIRKVAAEYFLTFALIGKPDIEAGVLNPIKGPSVREAANFILIIVNEGNFVINFINPETKKIMMVTALPGHMYQFFQTSGKLYSMTKIVENPVSPTSEQTPFYEPTSRYNWILYDDTPSKKKQGMKSGAVAGLGIAMLLIGIAIGIAGMYFYIKKTYGDTSVDHIAMHKQTP